MARFFGKVGYAELVQTKPGVWEEVFTERDYFGDVVRMSRALREAHSINDDVVPSNTFSIVADAYAYEHFHSMRYVIWSGAKWKITSVEVERPRLTLMVGGVYNA